MTQALAGYNEHGLFFATDSRATRFREGEKAEYFVVTKLFPLTRHSAIISGGAGVSVPLSQVLAREISRRRGLEDLEDVFDFAAAFLRQGIVKHQAVHPPRGEELKRIYFILGGFSPGLPLPGYRLLLLGSEEGEPLHPMPVGNLVVMPRNLGMEMRLFQALAAGKDLAALLAMCREFLEKMAAVKDEVGPPYHFATITPAGYEAVE
ncbi:MAG: hypothetical protein K6T55_01450 [Syntrophobacterales bacterium]|nr:hypothetical protein [Syntrophobacterales bacterium]